MKYKYKIGAVLLSVFMLAQIFGITSQAASGSVKVGNGSNTVGQNVTVTCTITCSTGPIGYGEVVLTYNQSALQWVSGTNMAQGGSGSVTYAGVTPDGSARSLSFNMTFKILKEGSHSVSVSTASASDIDENVFSPSRNGGVITGKSPSPSGGGNQGSSSGSQNTPAQPGKDSNSKLSSLQVYPGSLSPAFKANTKSYNVTVANDVTKVTISATAQSSKAKVTVSGGKDLKYGLNTAKVIVVAENGSSSAYVINIMRGQDEKISIAGQEYMIDENFTDEQIPQGFSRVKLTYKDREYEGLVNQTETLHLMCLKNDTESKFFVYDKETQGFSELVLIERGEGKYIIPLPLEERMDKYPDAEIISLQVQGKNLEAIKMDDEFSLVYALNQDGEEVLYRYDSVEEVFQRFTDAELNLEPVEVEPPAESLDEFYWFIMAILAGMCLFLFICLIYMIATRKMRREAGKKKALRKMEKQRIKAERIEEKERIAAEKEAEKQRRKEEKKKKKE